MSATSNPMNYLITGAGRGIGRGLTRRLLARGHRVFLVDSNLPELNNTSSLLLESGLPTSSFQISHTDLSDRSQISAAVASASAFFNGRLDVLINNAFATPHVWSDGASMASQEVDIMAEWDLKLAVGLTAPFLLSRLCIPLLTGPASHTDDDNAKAKAKASLKPGTIVHISSTRAHQAEENHEAYSAIKAGILGLTQSMSVSLGGQYNIRVNAISPGWIHVEDENASGDVEGKKWEDGLTEQDHRWHPAGRVGKVEDILNAVDFLVDSDFVTGTEIVVDGGVTKKMVYPE
ncbi:hypothetical protein H072_4127 [Dactylellina haptotyla CBS 200.50]|uniref:Uncharacterized protein n=1 Tax=Dactylellina haptotyla (strain CBS 200.50) TaxID=1284197 RepID=S8C2Q4_DACHA|nr:hypothetical protein H072_4127 [Dactylellina haptotyla CBS 200.50]